MRRWIAILLLCVASLYLGATSLDPCVDGVGDDCAPVCHVFCADGCATVPVPEAPASPVPVRKPRPVYGAERVEHLVSLDLEPEKDPPRA
jgi:hypothetical protein